MWAEVGKQPIRPKGQGRGIMVSDFIDEHCGYLRLSDQENEQAHENNPGLWKTSECGDMQSSIRERNVITLFQDWNEL